MLFNNYSQDDGHYIARGDVHVNDYEGYLTFVTITFNIMKRLCEKTVVPLIDQRRSVIIVHVCKTHIFHIHVVRSLGNYT